MPDPLYVAARRVLLDAVEAVRPHLNALVLVGAQAVYVHAGEADLAVAPYTTDGDLVIDPARLGPKPLLEEALAHAGFERQRDAVGIWADFRDGRGHHAHDRRRLARSRLPGRTRAQRSAHPAARKAYRPKGGGARGEPGRPGPACVVCPRVGRPTRGGIDGSRPGGTHCGQGPQDRRAGWQVQQGQRQGRPRCLPPAPGDPDAGACATLRRPPASRRRARRHRHRISANASAFRHATGTRMRNGGSRRCAA